MRVDAFVAQRSPDWDRLETLVTAAGSDPSRLSSTDVRQLGLLYRAAAGDLALARRRWPQHTATARLERLVVTARGLVYRSTRAMRLRDFLAHGYWRSVRERPAMLALSAMLLFGSATLGGVWGWRNPEQAALYVPASYRVIGEPGHFANRSTPSIDDETGMSGIIATNNIRVTFLAFAGGALFGVLTIFLLLQNGMLLGVLAGITIRGGNGAPFFELILPHGVLELSCIVVGAAAGFRVAWAVIAPGHAVRSTVVKRESVRAVAMILGTSVWLVVAALIESFVTPRAIGVGPAAVIGFGVAGGYWVLVWVLGRDRSGGRHRAGRGSTIERGTGSEAQILAESFSPR